MAHFLTPSIILLKEGTNTSQGLPHIIGNINACQNVVDVVKTTLGPRGMDKLIQTSDDRVVISNDGATILTSLEVVHPAARILVEIANAQDKEIGDGTTTVVVLAGEMMTLLKSYIEDGLSTHIVIRGLRSACQFAVEKIKNELSIVINTDDEKERRDFVRKCASTALNSKLVAPYKDFFSRLVCKAIFMLDEDCDLSMIGIKKVTGGGMEESLFVDGVGFKKTFSYAGFEQQPKLIKDCKIALLNIELELKGEIDEAEVRIDKVSEFQKVVDVEWKIIYDKLESIVNSGANVVLSKLAIGDLATQYFADRKIFCAGRVEEGDMRRMCKATGGKVQTTVTDLDPKVLGRCEKLEEMQIGSERFNIFSGCTNAKTATIILRGGAEHFIDEAERSLHDSIMVAKKALNTKNVVIGGGSIEMELSKMIFEHSRTIFGKEQIVYRNFARALEAIPSLLSANAGYDSIEILNELRKRVSTGERYCGVSLDDGTIANLYEKAVWEPMTNKINSITSATEAVCMLLSVDETIKNPSAEEMQQGTEFQERAAMMQGGGGPPMRR